jgi:hypothetical protein
MLNATKKNCPFFWVKKMLLVDTFPLWGEVLDSNSVVQPKKNKTYKLFFTQSMQNVKNPAQLNTKHARHKKTSKIGHD